MEALMQIGNRQRNETDPEMLQFLQCGEQVRDRPAPAIQSPHQHQVDLPAASGFQESLAGFSARGPGVHLANLHSNRPTAPGGILPHGAALHRQGLLVIGGNTGIQARSEHFCRLPCLAKNVSRFCLWRSLLYGHFGASPQHDRSRSFFRPCRIHHTLCRIQESASPCQRLAVVPGHPLRRRWLQLFRVPL